MLTWPCKETGSRCPILKDPGDGGLQYHIKQENFCYGCAAVPAKLTLIARLGHPRYGIKSLLSTATHPCHVLSISAFVVSGGSFGSQKLRCKAELPPVIKGHQQPLHSTKRVHVCHRQPSLGLGSMQAAREAGKHASRSQGAGVDDACNGDAGIAHFSHSEV
eukprot:366000-Chlamydomonas_euryale.AAC.29